MIGLIQMVATAVLLFMAAQGTWGDGWRIVALVLAVAIVARFVFFTVVAVTIMSLLSGKKVS